VLFLGFFSPLVPFLLDLGGEGLRLRMEISARARISARRHSFWLFLFLILDVWEYPQFESAV
jgi:hypothetical protein